MGEYMRIEATSCCGIEDLADISREATPEAVLGRVARAYFTEGRDRTAFLMFSGVVAERVRKYGDALHANRDDNYGQALADAIVARQLGTVTAAPATVNPRSRNTLQVWIWAVDWDALRSWWTAQEPQQEAAPAPTVARVGTMMPGPFLTNEQHRIIMQQLIQSLPPQPTSYEDSGATNDGGLSRILPPPGPRDRSSL